MKIALLFPGQGSQFVGMAKDMHEHCEKTRELYALTDKIFTDNTEESLALSQVSFEGPEEELKRTIFTQPAILTHSIAVANAFKHLIAEGKMTQPQYVAGHSLGEFSALYMADVLSLEDVLKLVIKRASLMEQAPAGAMTAVVGLDAETVDALIADVDNASVANYNAPDQIVITGSAEAMQEAGSKIEAYAAEKEARVKVIPLPVGGAFHSPLMQAASDEFSAVIDSLDFNDAAIPVIQNTTAKPVTDANEIKANLKKQMTGSVRWTETVAFLLQNVEKLYELGPGKVLSGLTKKQDRRFVMASIQGVEELKPLMEDQVAA